jgi:hypothetical protein
MTALTTCCTPGPPSCGPARHSGPSGRNVWYAGSCTSPTPSTTSAWQPWTTASGASSGARPRSHDANGPTTCATSPLIAARSTTVPPLTTEASPGSRHYSHPDVPSSRHDTHTPYRSSTPEPFPDGGAYVPLAGAAATVHRSRRLTLPIDVRNGPYLLLDQAVGRDVTLAIRQRFDRTVLKDRRTLRAVGTVCCRNASRLLRLASGWRRASVGDMRIAQGIGLIEGMSS